MDMIFLLSVVYFYLPGAVANIGANMGRFIPLFRKIDSPIDGGKIWKGHRLVGEHKTWGGFLSGMVMGMSFGLIKIFVLDKYWIGDLFVYTNTMKEIFLIILLSFGALTGDIIKSVAKRLIGIPPHDAWIPFDEIDHTTLAMIMVKIFFGIEWNLVFSVIGIIFILHLVSNIVGYKLKLKKVPY